MGLFTRRQGYGATVRAMSHLSAADREHGMDLLQATEDVFVDLGAPSRLGAVLFSAFAHGMGIDEDHPSFGVLGGASLMGYACRIASPRRDLPDDLADAVESQLILDGEGLDYEAMSEDIEGLGKLLEYTASLADNPNAIARLAGLTPDGWQAFATTATYQLHKNLLANGLPKRALPEAALLENMLRLGFAIRLVDELAVEEPIRKHEQPDLDENRREPDALQIRRADGAPLAVPIDVGSWLKDASGICTHNFEPYAEHVLDLITLDRLEIVPLMDALLGEAPDEVDEDVLVAMSNTRLGYALRNREIQLLGQGGYVAPDDPLAALLEERWAGEATMGTAVIFGVLRDVCTFNFLGGMERLFAVTPGTTAELRGNAMRRWVNEHYRGEDSRTGRNITITLLEYGYALHRLFEIHPEALRDV